MTLIGLIIYLSAGVGHTAILVFSLNWWYGQPLPHRFLGFVRLFHGGLVLLGIGAFASAFVDASLTQEWMPHQTVGQTLGLGYLFACSAIGLLVVPLFTLRRYFRPRPA